MHTKQRGNLRLVAGTPHPALDHGEVTTRLVIILFQEVGETRVFTIVDAPEGEEDDATLFHLYHPLRPLLEIVEAQRIRLVPIVWTAMDDADPLAALQRTIETWVKKDLRRRELHRIESGGYRFEPSLTHAQRAHLRSV